MFVYRRAALVKWKQLNGTSATYRNLIAAFEKAKRKDLVEMVNKIVPRMPGKYKKKSLCSF